MHAVVVIMILMVLLVGALLALTPRLMPSTECFAVTVPPSAQQDQRIRLLKRNYAMQVMAISIVTALVLCASSLALPLDSPRGATLFSVLTMVATFVPIIAGMVLMLRNRARVQEIKRAEGWNAAGAHVAAVVGTNEAAGPISLAWNLLYLPLVAALVTAGLLLYPRFPAQIPMQAGFDGTVTRYVDKSHAAVLFPAAVVTFLGIMMAFAHWSIVHSKRPVDPAAPATSVLAYGAFAHAQSVVLLAGGLVISAVTGIMFFLSSLGIVSLEAAGVLVSIAAVGFVAAEMWVSVSLGQSGARLAAQLRTSDEVARDDDAYWLLGMFYNNSDDPSIMVPKRFGIGWTINMGRPAAWALMALIAVLTIAFIVVINMLVG